MKSRTAELFLPAQAELGEGPVWDTPNNRLLWVDILKGHVHATTPAGDDSVIWRADGPIGCIAPRSDGTWIVAERDKLTAVTNWSSREELVVLPIDDDVRTNDGKLDPAGRMIIGTMQFDAEPDRGQLFSWDGDQLRVLLDQVTISNGLGWSPDGSTMYYIDTPTQEVAAYDYDVATGGINNRRVVVTIDEADGNPDGMCVGDDGRLWVALWGGAQVRCYLPGGTHEETIEVSATNVTCCAFREETLYITTARVASPEAPGDGGVFRIG